MENETSKPAVNIIMPTYNAHKTIRQAIGSVVMQDDLDNILLTIVDDCSDEPYDYLLDDFHYMNIEILRKPENTGCGQSRQYGIDRCKCKYFMFLDTDDCLYTHDAVRMMYSYIEKEQLDFLYTDFLEELNDEEYYLRQNSGVWMHGKMFRTGYIQQNDIRFSHTRLHEDHAFNILAQMCGGKNLYIDYKTYVWKRNPESLTRSPEHTFTYGMDNFIANAEYVMEELIKRNIDTDGILNIATIYVLTFYKYYNETVLYNLPLLIKERYTKQVKNYINSIPNEVKNKLTLEHLMREFYHSSTIQSMVENDVVFRVGFDEYYNKMMACSPDT